MNKASPSDEIATFVQVIDRGSFAAAAESVGMTPSGVSRTVSRLEARLGVRLLHRTTRRLALTPEGETLLARGRAILAAIEAAEAEVATARGAARGRVRVNTGTAYAKHRLLPLLPAFRARHPEVEIELSVADRRIDLIDAQVDVAVRTGPLGDSASLVARSLGESTRVICASPRYLRRHGRPRVPQDLERHTCLRLTGNARLAEWPMRIGARVQPHAVTGPIACDSADALRDMAVAGLGIVRLAAFMVEDALAAGDLVEVLAEHHVSETVPIHALMPAGRQHLPRVRALVDFMATHGATRRGRRPR